MRVTQRDVLSPSVLSRAFALLGCFPTDGTSLGVTELARRSGMPKATTHRMLQEMIKLGVVDRTGTGYQIGMRLFELGQLANEVRTLRDRALPRLDHLRERTGATVHMVVLDQTDVVYLEKLVGPRGPRVPTRPGGRMPAYCTGLGKAILAHSSTDKVQAVLDAGLERRTPRTITMPGLLIRELATAREMGVAFEWEESTVGLVCAASPVLDARGLPVAAISVAGLGNMIDPRRLAPAVRDTAALISRQIA
ncbi:IclR family transcriptional regulator [Nocardioides soli]|uniref:Glycerol operon regulatory protein n=1 Tax=Nocardioides soli TaxID=1036020 RepID=A0A7W4VYT7_9ACTN|nr:IclR family transcriptional regulator [Nocardioides soli]MBB3044023.1 DNA-binding IclR family transcriptional regulator [Nocardioides soli]